MQVTITTRRCDISEPLRERAALVIDRLATLSERVIEATAVFGTEAVAHTAELRLHQAGGSTLVATAEGPDHRTALDRAEGKLRRQILKASAKPRARRHSGSSSA